MTDYVARQFTLHYGAVQAGEPRQDKEKEACRRLGLRLAQLGRKVLLVDADLALANLDLMLGLKAERTIREVLDQSIDE